MLFFIVVLSPSVPSVHFALVHCDLICVSHFILVGESSMCVDLVTKTHFNILCKNEVLIKANFLAGSLVVCSSPVCRVEREKVHFRVPLEIVNKKANRVREQLPEMTFMR